MANIKEQINRLNSAVNRNKLLIHFNSVNESYKPILSERIWISTQRGLQRGLHRGSHLYDIPEKVTVQE